MRTLASRISHRLIREAKNRFGAKSDWLKKKARVDQEFDAARGVDTGGYTYLSSLKIRNPNWRDGTSHIATDPEEFKQAMDAVDADLARFTFIDLGAGKGRALMLAAEYPFKQLIGIEFSDRLVEIARSNLRGTNIEVLCGDATEYELPAGPMLLFLSNPFGRATMDVVAERTRASLERSPRELIVLYLNPFHVDAWLNAGFQQTHRGPHFSVLSLAERSS